MSILSEDLKLQEELKIEPFANFLLLSVHSYLQLLQGPSVSKIAKTNLKTDFVRLLANCFDAIDGQTLKSILREFKSSLPAYIVQVLGEFHIDFTSFCIQIIGNILVCDDDLCTNIIANTPLIDYLPTIMSQGDTQMRSKVLWVLTNIICNGPIEVETVIRKGLVSNISLALRDHTQLVRREAMWAFASLLQKKDDLVDLLSKFEIEMTIL